PNAFDIEYTRNLGFAAFEFLQNGGTNAIISIQNNQIVPLAFDSILDADTGRTQVRMVNINSIQYRIARQYMIRVEKQDFHSNGLKRMALLARLPPDEFVKKFKYLTE
ncbi:MAG: 6-phosphofructokinase, partial [Negativicutes bacterium]|nr:6-phosphofructokinase [Negativicutes bacterium]